MWVRIDEISFAVDRADDVIAHTRNNAVATHQGESFLGFRLLVDRPHGRALNVSYWDDLDDATRNDSGPVTDPATGPRPPLCERISTSCPSTPPDPAQPHCSRAPVRVRRWLRERRFVANSFCDGGKTRPPCDAHSPSDIFTNRARQT